MQYVVKQGQNIYDVAVIVYGDAQYSVKLATDNGLTITDSIEGLTLNYEYIIKTKVLSKAISQQNTPKQPDRSYFIKQVQSVYDLTLQFGYGIDNIVKFCTDTGLEINSQNNGGSTIQVTKIPNNLPTGIIFATEFITEDTTPYYLLQEDGFYLLQENGFKIQL